jgi:hypothetical protein
MISPYHQSDWGEAILQRRNLCEFRVTSLQRTFTAVVFAVVSDCRDKEARLIRSVLFAVLGVLIPVVAIAQITPAAGYTPPDDTPSIRVGMTLFPAYVYQTTPTATDADGNIIRRNNFDVLRAYINVTGQLSHIVAFRITPDITRESGLLTLGAGNSIPNDSLVYRIKYAYAQFNLDDWMTKGSWARFGIQQTPWVDFDEGIYRYRFQGTTFAERVPLPTSLASSDGGISFHYNLPSNYGDFHVGYYNGENYQRVETSDQKGLEFRGTLRPFATMAPVLRGIRAHLVYYGDHYQTGAERNRWMANVTFEQQYLNAEFDYLSGKDQVLIANPAVNANGWAVWATPKLPKANGSSFEALLRYDHWVPNTSNTLAPASSSTLPGVTTFDSQHQNRVIVGGAYWFPHTGNVQTAILFDWDAQSFDNIAAPAPQRVFGIHGLLNF